MSLIQRSLVGLGTFAIATLAIAADPLNVTGDKFRQLDELLPTPNSYRNAAGAPGHEYWQQQADYEIDVTLDDDNQRISASEVITYTNNSPDDLTYLWVQLDQNRFKPDSDLNLTSSVNTDGMGENTFSYRALRNILAAEAFDGGYNIEAVTDRNGNSMNYTIVGTMMRIDLDRPLRAGSAIRFGIDWSYNIVDQRVLGGRAGYEYFERDDNYLYEIAQWYPRMAAYNDVSGWQNKQFIGSGEFAIEFGDYKVRITVPSDHIVASTGVLQNESAVLTREQRQRLSEARTADAPVFVVTLEEALENEKEKATDTKTWEFHAENVRDFAWASSRKFVWDAQGYKSGETDTMAMSFYPQEGMPIFDRYSTAAIIHTMEHYNKYSFDYPYPTSISVNGPVGGMEYPMITFNGPRPDIDLEAEMEDGVVTPEEIMSRTYSRGTKWFLIGVVIHEVGHNYFPMIVNSDERQWTWMDEGLNTYLEFLALQAWEDTYDANAQRGEAREIVDYMRSENQVPIMTNSESILQFGNNAYGKPATALNILRETVMGRELFDHAFREYSQRWKFKRPMPADFFRTMEDASGIDLDWFWRGWFYTTDAVDISLDNVRHYTIDTRDPDLEEAFARAKAAEVPRTITQQRNEGMVRKVELQEDLLDFYNENDHLTTTNADRNAYQSLVEGLEDWERELLLVDNNIYVMDFSNIGGLVMPLIIEMHYDDGSVEEVRIPAEIWRRNSNNVSKMFVRSPEKLLTHVVLDPHLETADIDTQNNHFPRRMVESRLQLFKNERPQNMMQKWSEELNGEDEDSEEAVEADTE